MLARRAYALDADAATTNHPASVRERGETVSIVLKTDPKDLQFDLDFHVKGSNTWMVTHSALAAHAMQMAIEQAKSHGWLTVPVKWLDERAADNLARLLGEGMGKPTQDQLDAAHDAFQDVYDGDNHRAAIDAAVAAALASLAPAAVEGDAMPCLGCDSLQCKDCFARHAAEMGYVRASLEAEPIAWITQDDLRKLLAKEDNVIACAFFEGVQQNYVSLYTAAQLAALTAQCAEHKRKSQMYDDLMHARTITAKDDKNAVWKKLATEGRNIEAIKECRAKHGFSLFEAKNCVEAFLAGNGEGV
jgi:ribosomal protein L7/L12